MPEQKPADLVVWTITAAPVDFPTVPFVVRGWLVTPGGPVDTGALGFADTLDEARAIVPEGLHRVDRSPDDDPVIVESWL